MKDSHQVLVAQVRADLEGTVVHRFESFGYWMVVAGNFDTMKE